MSTRHAACTHATAMECTVAVTPFGPPLAIRYADLLPLLCAKLVSLEDDFPITRRVAGDGNCFYRAALFGLLEHVLAAPDPQLAERWVEAGRTE